MVDKRFQTEHQSIQLGDDGELVGAKFCAYCGAQNAADVDYCQFCAEYIADQGPDLTARLARISRRANAIPIINRPGDLIGTERAPNRIFTELAGRSSNVWKWRGSSPLVPVLHIVALALEVIVLYYLLKVVLFLIIGR